MARISAEVLAMNPPGVMLYFDLRHQISFFSDEELGTLFKAILEYGETGVLPDFADPDYPDRSMKVLWTTIQEKIDLGRQHYWKEIEDRRFAAYRKHTKDKGQEPLNREEWEEMIARKERQELHGNASDNPSDLSLEELRRRATSRL